MSQLPMLMPSSSGIAERARSYDGVGNHAAWQREMERAQVATWFSSDPLAVVGTAARSPSLATMPVLGIDLDLAAIPIRPATERAGAAPAYAAEAPAQPRSVVWTEYRQGERQNGVDMGACSLPVGDGAVPVDAQGVTTLPSIGEGAAHSESPVATVPASGIPVMAERGGGFSNSESHTAISSIPVSVSIWRPDHAPVWRREPVDVHSTQAVEWLVLAEREHVRIHAQWAEDGVTVWLGLEGAPDDGQSRLAGLVAGLRQVLDEQGLRLKRVICNGRQEFSVDDASGGSVAPGGGAIGDARQLLARFGSIFAKEDVT